MFKRREHKPARASVHDLHVIQRRRISCCKLIALVGAVQPRDPRRAVQLLVAFILDDQITARLAAESVLPFADDFPLTPHGSHFDLHTGNSWDLLPQ